MTKLSFVIAVCILAAPLAADAQSAGRVPRIGFLLPAPLAAAAPYVEAFRLGLRETGWVDGRNVIFEVRSADGHDERFRELADELVGLKVDAIVVSGDFGARAARQATATIPIVMCPNSDPLGTGLVDSLARPGGNVTGLSMMSPEFTLKQLQLLLEVVPKVSLVAVLWNPDFPSAAGVVKETERGARTLRARLQTWPVRDAKELERAFSSMTRERAGGLLVVGSPFMFIHRRVLAELAAQSQLPAIYDVTEHVLLGGLMSYGPNLRDLFFRAAGYVDKILRGVKPKDLPVEQPTKFDLMINLKTAKALGLTIPPSLLLRAGQVIE